MRETPSRGPPPDRKRGQGRLIRRVVPTEQGRIKAGLLAWPAARSQTGFLVHAPRGRLRPRVVAKRSAPGVEHTKAPRQAGGAAPTRSAALALRVAATRTQKTLRLGTSPELPWPVAHIMLPCSHVRRHARRVLPPRRPATRQVRPGQAATAQRVGIYEFHWRFCSCISLCNS
jgi:hypothetical protein